MADQRLHEIPYSLSATDDEKNGAPIGVASGDGPPAYPLFSSTAPESGIIDALFLKEGVWTIVEFKTDRVKDKPQLDRVCSEKGYVAQTRRYTRAVAQLLGVRPRSALCFLNFAGGVHVLPVTAED